MLFSFVSPVVKMGLNPIVLKKFCDFNSYNLIKLIILLFIFKNIINNLYLLKVLNRLELTHSSLFTNNFIKFDIIYKF